MSVLRGSSLGAIIGGGMSSMFGWDPRVLLLWGNVGGMVETAFSARAKKTARAVYRLAAKPKVKEGKPPPMPGSVLLPFIKGWLVSKFVVERARKKVSEAGWHGGMDPVAALYARRLAMKLGHTIRFRPVNKYAISLRIKGHPGKPQFLKMKSINELDVHLGAKRKDLGKVGYFAPVLPANYLSLPKKLRKQIRKRYASRAQEQADYGEDVARLEKEGTIKLKNGVVIDRKTGKAFTSDYDLFDITTKTASGRVRGVYYDKPPEGMSGLSLTKRQLKKYQHRRLKTEHGDLMGWDVKAKDLGPWAAMLKAARRRGGKGEKLITFTPNGKISYTSFDD